MIPTIQPPNMEKLRTTPKKSTFTAGSSPINHLAVLNFSMFGGFIMGIIGYTVPSHNYPFVPKAPYYTIPVSYTHLTLPTNREV